MRSLRAVAVSSRLIEGSFQSISGSSSRGSATTRITGVSGSAVRCRGGGAGSSGRSSPSCSRKEGSSRTVTGGGGGKGRAALVSGIFASFRFGPALRTSASIRIRSAWAARAVAASAPSVAAGLKWKTTISPSRRAIPKMTPAPQGPT